MRRKVTLETLNQFMRELAATVRSIGKMYFTGGVTALLLGFRDQTIDIDLKFDPEPAGAFEAIAVAQDLEDVVSLWRGGYITANDPRKCFAQIEPGLLRYPAVYAVQFRKRLEDFLANAESQKPDVT